jgi:hypothetical protein
MKATFREKILPSLEARGAVVDNFPNQCHAHRPAIAFA